MGLGIVRRRMAYYQKPDWFTTNVFNPPVGDG